jgi:hypothetical protein
VALREKRKDEGGAVEGGKPSRGKKGAGGDHDLEPSSIESGGGGRALLGLGFRIFGKELEEGGC